MFLEKQSLWISGFYRSLFIEWIYLFFMHMEYMSQFLLFELQILQNSKICNVSVCDAVIYRHLLKPVLLMCLTGYI